MEIKTLLKEFCDYSLYIRGRAKTTIKTYKTVADMFCRSTGVVEIEEINTDLVRDWFYKGRRDRKWSPNCFVTYHKNLIVFFRWCVDNHHIESNPAEDIELPRLEKRIPPKLTKQDSMKLLEFVYNYPYDYKYLRFRNHAIFSMFILCAILYI